VTRRGSISSVASGGKSAKASATAA